MSPVEPSLLSLLVCPVCTGELQERSEGLACLSCRCVYPVAKGIPILLPSRARMLPEDRRRGSR
jgi:uncharacterized protein YbaR (Trm112 family)